MPIEVEEDASVVDVCNKFYKLEEIVFDAIDDYKQLLVGVGFLYY
jgi:hypothetical protein